MHQFCPPSIVDRGVHGIFSSFCILSRTEAGTVICKRSNLSLTIMSDMLMYLLFEYYFAISQTGNKCTPLTTFPEKVKPGQKRAGEFYSSASPISLSQTRQ